MPGNTALDIVESDPSEIVSASAGSVTLTMKPATAKPGRDAKPIISIDNAYRVSGEGLEIRVAYDTATLTPITQITPTQETVKRTGLSRNLTVTDNAATASGELVITGTAGILEPGAGKLFQLVFRVHEDAPSGSAVDVMITSALIQDVDGNPINVTIVHEGGVLVGSTYGPGDVTGDGIVDTADKDLLKQLTKKKARDPTPDEMRAGDLNGDGKLDAKDVTLLLRLLRGLDLNGG